MSDDGSEVIEEIEKTFLIQLSETDFKCSISRDYLIDPVLASDGHVYERKYIKKWLSEHETSPITRQTIDKKLIKCHKFNEILNNFYQLNPQYKPFSIVDVLKSVKNGDYNYKKYIDVIDRANEERLVTSNSNEKTQLLQNLRDIFSTDSFVDFLIDYKEENMCKWKGYNNWMLINFVCEFGSLKSIKKILTCPDIDLKNAVVTNQFQPIHFICSKYNTLNEEEQLEVIMFAIEHKMDFEAKTGQKNRPIHFICSTNTKLRGTNKLRAIELLINAGVDINARTNEENAPIHLVCSDNKNLYEQNQLDAIKLLVKNGADIEKQNNRNELPINLLSIMENTSLGSYWLEAVQYMINIGSNVSGKRMKLSFY